MITVNDKIQDNTIKNFINIDKMASGEKNKVLKELENLEKELQKSLAGGRLTNFGKVRVNFLLKQINLIVDDTYRKINTVNNGIMKDTAEISSKLGAKSVNNAIGINLLDPIIPPSVLKSVVSGVLVQGSPAKDWWLKQSRDLQLQVSSKIRTGILRGDNNYKILQSLIGTKRLNYTDGVMRASKRNATALVRTSVMTVANDARMEMFDRNEDVLKGYQHLSTLDSKTSDICKARSGLIWNMDRQPVGHSFPFQNPPLHWNCRSTLIPLTKSWEELNAKTKGKIKSKSVRASMDGTVPADLNYEQWLETKDISFQKEVLGPGKYKLWKEGKINMRDLITGNNKVLTIEQLQEGL